MDKKEFGFESMSISIAGIDYVENTLGKDDPQSFFRDLVSQRPKLERQLMAWLAFEEKERGRRNVREIVFDLLQHTMDQFTEVEEVQTSNQKVKTNG